LHFQRLSSSRRRGDSVIAILESKKARHHRAFRFHTTTVSSSIESVLMDICFDRLRNEIPYGLPLMYPPPYL